METTETLEAPKKLLAPYIAQAGGERSRWYMGALFTFLATAKDTDGQYALIETVMRKGMEPPRHMHTYDDEMMYVLDGEVIFNIGENECHAKAGDTVYMPKHLPHHFKIQTDTAKFLINIFPAGLEDMFMQMSIPAESNALPPRPAGPPAPEWIQKIQGLQEKFGIVGIDNSHIKGA